MRNVKFEYVLKSKRLTALVVATVISVTLSSTKVQADTVVSRLSGVNRYETAAKICQDGWKEATDYAVIVNGENFPDALSSAPLAKKFNAPVLLTDKDALSPYTSVELNRLNVKNVFIIGGKGVVSQSIEDGLKARGIKVTRLGGANRYETALQVAAKLGKSNQIALVNGNDFHDGISISSIAAIKGMPIILTDKDSMPSSVSKYLQSNKKADQIYIIGGTDKISDSIIGNVPNAKRIGSGDAYGINTGIIEAFQDEISTGTLYIASAKDFPDSLGASALAPKTFSPVLFVDSPISEDTKRFLKSNIVNNLKVLGGTGAIAYETEQIAKTLPLGVSQTENITDTIWQDQKYSPRATMVIMASDGNKKEVPVEWNLTKVNTTKPGIYTFKGKIQGTEKIVYTTLIVKPLPYKIDDITETANSRYSYSLPTTIEAQMTDGTRSQVAVSWDYGTQQANKPGVYVFNGTVDKYSKKVKLTLTVNNTDGQIKKIKSINNLKYIVDSRSKFKLPNKVKAIMEDNSTQEVAVTWGPERPYGAKEGVYIYEGTVSGYNHKVNLMLIIKGENGVDPNDPNYPGKPVDPNDPNNPDNPDVDVKDLGELEPIMQGDPYPSTVTDPKTNKPMQVTWNNAVSIDTSSNVDSVANIDNCRISKITLEGVSGKTNVRATVGVIPKIVSIIADGGSENDTNIIVNIDKSKYSNGIVDMNDVTNKLKAVIVKPNGDRLHKDVTVLLWNPPYIDISNSNTYYAVATIKHCSNPVVITIKIN